MSATKICSEDDLEVGSAVRVVIDGLPIALVRDSAGAVHAIGDTCTHGDISLAEGFVGKPTSLPAYEPVPVYPVTIVEGEVFIDPAAGVIVA